MFTNLEIQLIDKVIGQYCERRISLRVRDQLRLIYAITNNEVVILEERLVKSSADWISLEIAKLRYVRVRNEWRLYWVRASGKWWPYEPHVFSTLEAVVREIDLDSNGCFFG